VWAAALHPGHDCFAVRDAMIAKGSIVRAINTDTNAFCPPLVTTDAEIDRLLDAFEQSLPR
jgi:adenosylmethionine-8-amino-7-oxononanoate aminotransferase